ncbi:MAG: DUF1501 domain-containing protein [bacterium]|nr:DUF1501 domain-containing protein [bacterium]
MESIESFGLASQKPCVASRRDWLRRTALGFGSVALAGLCAEHASAGNLAAKPTHFAPRAKRVIFLFMQGGQSQMDLFDNKPELNRRNGQDENKGKLMGATHAFERYGQSGLEMSRLIPHLGRHADDICLLRSMVTDSNNHSNAMLCFHTGSQNFVRPSVGSWVVYGLGTENDSLPGFITIRPTRGHGSRVYSNAFLPAIYQGSAIGDSGVSAREMTFRDLHNSHLSTSQQRQQLDLTRVLNEHFHQQTAATSDMEGLIESYELAFRMQTESPKLFDLSDEPQHVLDAYGVNQKETDEVGRMCLLARRFAESGVRYIQVNHGGWDHHGSIVSGLERSCQAADQPIGALLTDLKQRGLLEDTLVVSSGEFGRTATAEGEGDKAGRGHNAAGFTLWMAGGGVRGGTIYGATDDLGVKAVEGRAHIHDLNATLLHLLGLDHQRLTYPYAGRDFRLTDVYGRVLHDIVS